MLRSAVDLKALGLHPQVRRWDLPVGGLIEVRFGVGEYHTRDYWVI